MDSELLASLIEAISVLNQKLSDLESDTDEIKKEVYGFQSEYAKQVKILQDQIDAVTVTIDRLIREAIKDIEFPKDGKDGVSFDEKVAKALITAQINKMIKQRNLETEKIKADVLEAVNDIEVPRGERGEAGKSVTDEQIDTYITSWLDANIDSLRGDKGDRGIQGERGTSGVDGISITDAKIVNDFLVLTFSDGSVKRVKMPRTVKYLGGGAVGGESVDLTVFRNRTELEGMFNATYSTAFSELIYTSGNISQVKITNEISTQTLTKDISYVDGNISEIRVA